MPYLAVDEDGTEGIFNTCPDRVNNDMWWYEEWSLHCSELDLPKGTIEKIIGRSLTWEDEPVQI
jgi:hypothetical protein